MSSPMLPEPTILPLETTPSASPLPDPRHALMTEFLQARSLQPNSQRAYRRDLQRFMDWTDQPWATVSRRQMAQFKHYLVQDQQLAPSSVNRILQTLKTFYKWMVVSEYLAHNPTTGIQPEPLPPAQSQELEDAEVAQIYAAIAGVSADPVRDRALFSLLLHGLRAEEVVQLNLGDYDGQQVIIRQAKHQSIGEVPLLRSAQQDVDAYIAQRQAQTARSGIPLTGESPLLISNSNRSQGKRLTYWGIQDVMQKLAKHTGIDLHAHRGRHTFCTNLIVKLELDPTLAMELSRHRDLRSFKRYTNRKQHLAAKRAFLNAANRLEPHQD